MIEKITLKNFQCHKKLELKLHPGVNIIVGTSDSGKSAIMRAIGWVIQNKPSGDAFRSYWDGDTWINIETDDHHCIIRKKTNTINSYFVDGLELTAFGQSTPIEVQNILNSSPLNIQSQLEPHFLLSQSPGEVARILNKIVDLDIIDISFVRITKRIKNIQNEIKYSEEQLESIQQEIQEYENLPEMERAITHVEKLEAERDDKGTKIISLGNIITEYKRCGEKQKALIQILAKEFSVNQLWKRLQVLINKDEKIQALVLIISMQTKLEVKLQATKILIPQQKIITSCLAKIEKLKQLEKQSPILFDLVGFFGTYQKNYEKVCLSIKRYEDKFHELMPDECPLCGQKIKIRRG